MRRAKPDHALRGKSCSVTQPGLHTLDADLIMVKFDACRCCSIVKLRQTSSPAAINSLQSQA